MSHFVPADYIRDNILTYYVKPCQTVVFYLNFDWNTHADWMVYQNYDLPVTAFMDTHSDGAGGFRSVYAVEIPCTVDTW